MGFELNQAQDLRFGMRRLWMAAGALNVHQNVSQKRIISNIVNFFLTGQWNQPPIQMLRFPKIRLKDEINLTKAIH